MSSCLCKYIANKMQVQQAISVASQPYAEHAQLEDN